MKSCRSRGVCLKRSGSVVDDFITAKIILAQQMAKAGVIYAYFYYRRIRNYSTFYWSIKEKDLSKFYFLGLFTLTLHQVMKPYETKERKYAKSKQKKN